jgi:hypothetical protein
LGFASYRELCLLRTVCERFPGDAELGGKPLYPSLGVSLMKVK